MAASRLLGAAACVRLVPFAAESRESYWSGCIKVAVVICQQIFSILALVIFLLKCLLKRASKSYFSPHLCVGFLFLILYPAASSASASSSAAPLSHSHNFVLHNFVTHHLTHTTLSHTIFVTHLSHSIFVTHHLSHTISLTQLCHIPSFTHHLTHTTLSHTIFVTHHLLHTIFLTPSHPHNFVTHHLSHTISLTQLCHTQLCHAPSSTPNFVTHHLSHTISLTQLCHTHHFSHTIWFSHHLTHTTLSRTIFHTPSHSHNFVTHHLCHTHTLFHTQLCHTPSFIHHLTHTTLSHTTWQAWRFLRLAWHGWHLATSTFSLRGRRGAWRHSPSLCMAGVALGDIHLRFAWPAWHLATSTLVLCGTRGACGTGLALVARLGAVSHPGRRTTLRGRRGAWWHPPAFCVAGMAPGDIHLGFVWHAWRLRHWAGSGGALGRG